MGDFDVDAIIGVNASTVVGYICDFRGKWIVYIGVCLTARIMSLEGGIDGNVEEIWKGDEDWTEMTWNNVKFLGPQKSLEDSLLDTKEAKTPTMTLDLQSAAKVFTNMVIHLGKRQRITGIPLAYVVRCSLNGPNNADIDNETKYPPMFGQQGTPYFSIDDEPTTWAPILHHDLTHQQLAASLETLASDGPFEPNFLTDMVLVYNVIHSCWGKSGWWSHVKKFSKSKNGRQVYRTMHSVLLGGQQVVSTGSAIIAKFQSFRYKGERQNFNFDKYVNLHIEQHNQQADLQEYSVAPLAENLKTLWFQDGIKCNLLDAVKASINANRVITLLTLTL